MWVRVPSPAPEDLLREFCRKRWQDKRVKVALYARHNCRVRLKSLTAHI